VDLERGCGRVTMIVSLNEIESLALKAARGAGMSWGLAEEAAAAAAWLARQDLPWAETLAGILAGQHATSPPQIAADAIAPSHTGSRICPILCGALLSDLGPAAGITVVHDVLAPVWLAPFVARWVGPDRVVRLGWPDVSLRISQDGAIGTDAAAPGLALTFADRVEIVMEPSATRQAPPRQRQRTGYITPEDAWHALQAFEHRTYVPASAQSRLAGAGAGLLDND
jgi:uncharacterized protein DUF3726